MLQNKKHRTQQRGARHISRQSNGKKAWKKGLLSETVAVVFLRCKGYQILARRLRTPLGEIDIVACKKKALIVAEVKCRPSLQQGLESISVAQQERLLRAVGWFLSSKQQYQYHDIRFDCLIAVPWRWIYHVKNAWTKDG